MDDLHQKLERLKAEYRESLRMRMDAILALWASLQDEMLTEADEILRELHIKIHSLAGSAATFGFSEVSKNARALENLFLCGEASLHTTEITHMMQTLQICVAQSLDETTPP